MQYLLLTRHGNTFSPTDKVIWVGSQNDLPLVESGMTQANELGEALIAADVKPQAIYAGPLKRTFNYAEIIRQKLKQDIPITIDNRLCEIDYGQWSGLTTEEIIQKFGNYEIDKWQNQGIWPNSFNGSEEKTIAQVFSFVDNVIVKEPSRRLTLAVSSNGCLKYFLQLASNTENISHQWKVSTGKTCLLAFTNARWNIIGWNIDPKKLCTELHVRLKALADIT